MTIVANVIAVIASVLMVIGGYFKSKKVCLVLQAVQLMITVIVACLLGAVSSAIVNGISVFRNVLAYKNKLNIIMKIIMNILVFILIMIFANNIIDYFPFVAFFIYTIVLDKVNDIQFKWLNNIVMILWTVYDFSFHAYVFFVFDILYIIMNNITLTRMYRNKRAAGDEPAKYKKKKDLTAQAVRSLFR